MKIIRYSFLVLIILLSFVNTSYPYSNDKAVSVNAEIIDPIPYIDDFDDYSLIDDEILSLVDSYPEFISLLKKANIDIPLLDKFIPQGIALVDNYLLIAGYYEDGSNSKCYVLDSKGVIINVVEFDTNSHVGGIAYDQVNELIWVPDNDGVINAYKKDEIIAKKIAKAWKKFYDVGDGLIDYLDENKKHVAYVAIDEGYLYIGNFYKKDKCLVKKYRIIFDDFLRLEYVHSFYLPPKVQGLSFYEKDGKKYMVVSGSYNRRTPSNILVYEYNEKIKDYTYYLINSVIIPPMSEQLVIRDNELYLIFESGASKYFNSLDKVKKVCVLDMDKLV